jgi:hypothetical protein
MNKKKRFKIFERDSFTCQYCGVKPPNVILEVDHMVSKFDGGGDEEENLITSCFNCNRGKSKKSVTTKQRTKSHKQKLKELEEKTLQLEAYYEFKSKLIDFQDSVLEKICSYWECSGEGDEFLTENGKKSMANLLKTNSFEDIIDSIDIAFKKNIDAHERFKYVCGVLKNKKLERENPEKFEQIKEGHRFKYQLLKKLPYINDKWYWKFINDGVTIEEMEEALDESYNWTGFKNKILTRYYS